MEYLLGPVEIPRIFFWFMCLLCGFSIGSIIAMMYSRMEY